MKSTKNFIIFLSAIVLFYHANISWAAPDFIEEEMYMEVFPPYPTSNPGDWFYMMEIQNCVVNVGDSSYEGMIPFYHYLSYFSTPSSYDYAYSLMSYTVNGLKPGEKKCKKFKIKIDKKVFNYLRNKFSSTARGFTGQFYLINHIDPHRRIPEEIKTSNNRRVKPISFPSNDYEISCSNIKSVQKVGNTYKIDISIKTKKRFTSYFRKILLTVTYYQNNRKYMVLKRLITLNSNGTWKGSVEVRPPNGLEPGKAKLEVSINSDGNVPDFNYSNDRCAKSVQAQVDPNSPDIAVDRAKLKGLLKYGGKNYIQICIKNNGKKATDKFLTKLYFRYKDMIRRYYLEKKISEFSMSSIGPGGKSCGDYSFLFSPDLPDTVEGELLVLADPDKHPELNKGNNLFKIPVKPKYSKLIITEFSGVPKGTPTAGQQVNSKVCVKNEGLGRSNPSAVEIFYSSLAYLSDYSRKEKLAEAAIPALASGGSLCKYIPFKLPPLPNKKDFIIAIIRNNPPDIDDPRKRKTRTFEELPDLVIDSFSAPDRIMGNELVKGTVCIKNIGDKAANPFSSEIYLAKYPYTSKIKQLVQFRVNKVLKPDEIYCYNYSFQAPTTIKIEKYYLIAYADHLKDVREIIETNNKSLKEVLGGGPDLIITSMSGIPSTVVAGQSYNARVCVKNIGKKNSLPTDLVILLSDNTIISRYDKSIGSANIPLLAPQVEKCINVSVKFPLNPDNYSDFSYSENKRITWLSAAVDFKNRFTEENEKNNFYLPPKKLYYLPGKDVDLSFGTVKLSMPYSVPNAQFTVTEICVKKVGTSFSEGFDVAIYYSGDSKLSSDDILLKRAYIPLLPPGTTQYCKKFHYAKLFLPKKIAPNGGDNWLIFSIDPDNQISETNEKNNLFFHKFKSVNSNYVDLRPSKFMNFPKSGFMSYTSYDVKLCIENAGNTDVSTPFTADIYYSTNDYISTSDKKIGSVTFSQSIPSGKTVCQTVKLSFNFEYRRIGGWFSTKFWPQMTAYIGAIVDPQNKIKELNEYNNTGYVAYFINAYNLRISKFSAPRRFELNRTYSTKICVQNIGNVDINKPFDVAVLYSARHWSKWSSQSEGKVLSNTTVTKPIPAGKEHCFYASWRFSSQLPPRGWIAAVANFKWKLPEAYRDDNYYSLHISRALPDLTVTSITFAANPLRSRSFSSMTFCLQNIGSKDVTSPFSVKVDFTALGNSLGYKTINITTSELPKLKKGLPPYCKKLFFQAPIVSSKVEVTVDHTDKVQEEIEYNNRKVADLYVLERTIWELVVTKLKLTPNVTKTKSSVTADVCILNVGQKALTYPVDVGIVLSSYLEYKFLGEYLSKLLYQTTIANGFKGGETKCFKAKFTVPTKAKTSRGTEVPLYPGYWEVEVRPNFLKRLDSRQVKVKNKSAPLYIEVDVDNDGVYTPHDCNDRDPTIFPAYMNRPAAKELCDGKDNDCDGKIDEDFAKLGQNCTAGRGECKASGVVKCRGDGKGTECSAKAKPPQKELCDGKDNDCDGKIDEDFAKLGQNCTAGRGECKALGKIVCKKGGSGTECSAKPKPPQKEKCNGKDDDCDGQIDNNADADCAGGEVCKNGQCVKKGSCKTDADCASGEICKNGFCVKKPSCQKDADCGVGKICKNGQCAPKPCSDTCQCPPQFVCFRGFCQKACKNNSDCRSNEACRDGLCWKSCGSGGVCPKSMRCVSGRCVDICHPSCKNGEICFEKRCVPDSCKGYGCPHSFKCTAKGCVPTNIGGFCQAEPIPERVTEPAGERVEPAGERVEPTGERVEPIGERVEPVGERAESTSEVEGDEVLPELPSDGGAADELAPSEKAALPDQSSAEPPPVEGEPNGESKSGSEAGEKGGVREDGSGRSEQGAGSPEENLKGDGGSKEGCGCSGTSPLSSILLLLVGVWLTISTRKSKIKGRLSKK